MVIKIILLVCISLTMTRAASTVRKRKTNFNIDNFDFIKFKISRHEEKLLQILPPHDFESIKQNYNHLPGCVQAVSNLMLHNSNEMFSQYTVNQTLIDAIENYSQFMGNLFNIGFLCIDQLKSSGSSIDILKATEDILFNKSVLMKFIHIERSFFRFLENFSYLITKNTSIIKVVTSQMLFYKEYIELLFQNITTPLSKLNSISDYNDFIRDNKDKHKKVVRLFLECFPIIILKQTMNIFILLFEDKIEQDFGEGTSNMPTKLEYHHELIVREEFRGYNIHSMFIAKGKDFDLIIGSLFLLLGDMKMKKDDIKKEKARKWKEEFITNSLEETKEFSKQLFVAITQF